VASELAPLDRGNPCGLSATTEASDNPEEGKSEKRLRLKVSNPEALSQGASAQDATKGASH